MRGQFLPGFKGKSLNDLNEAFDGWLSHIYHQSQPQQVEVKYQNKSFGMLMPVNLNVNCRIKRDKNNNPQIHTDTQLNEYGGGKLWSSKRTDNDEQ